MAQIYGRPAASLGGDTSWASGDSGALKGGAAAELNTAAALNAYAARFPVTVMHDLSIPGSNANIDHLVVAGDHVLLLDTKWWKPGTYVTVAGRTWHLNGGKLARADKCDKRTMVMARERLAEHLKTKQRRAHIAALVVVEPSNTRSRLRLWPATFPGADMVASSRLESRISRYTERADPFVVDALRPLLRAS